MPKIKHASEMDFNEFLEWATPRLADAIIRGGFKEMKSELFLILQQAAQNTVFRGSK